MRASEILMSAIRTCSDRGYERAHLITGLGSSTPTIPKSLSLVHLRWTLGHTGPNNLEDALFPATTRTSPLLINCCWTSSLPELTCSPVLVTLSTSCYLSGEDGQGVAGAAQLFWDYGYSGSSLPLQLRNASAW